VKKLNLSSTAPFSFPSGSFYRSITISLYNTCPLLFTLCEASQGYFGNLARPIQTQFTTQHFTHRQSKCPSTWSINLRPATLRPLPLSLVNVRHMPSGAGLGSAGLVFGRRTTLRITSSVFFGPSGPSFSSQPCALFRIITSLLCVFACSASSRAPTYEEYARAFTHLRPRITGPLLATLRPCS
jgi:hypothetical protein